MKTNFTEFTPAENELLNKYIVIENVSSERRFIILRTNFEEIDMCDAYSSYGIKIDCSTAGCYALENSESSAQIDCLKAIRNEFKIEFEDIDDIEDENILNFIKDWKKENEIHCVCTAYTFYNGVSLESLILEAEEYVELDAIEQIKILLEFDPTAFIHFDGVKIVDTENYSFRASQFAGVFYEAEII